MTGSDQNQLTRVRRVARAFGPDVRKRRGTIAGGVVFAVIYALARAIEPWPLKVVFDQVLFHKPARGATTQPFLVFGSSTTALLIAAAAILILSGLARGVSYFWQDYLLSTAAQQIVYGIRTRLYRHLHLLPQSFYQRRRTGDLLVRLSADIILLRDVLIDFVANVFSGAVMVALMLAIMILVDPVLTLVALAVMPAIVGLSWLYGKQIRSNAHKQRKREGQVAAVMHEALSAMSVVQLHGAEDREQERFHEINRRSLKQGVKGARLEARMNRGVELALAGGTVVIVWVGTLRALHGAITPGTLIVFVSYLRAAYRPLRRSSKSVQRSAKALSAAERIVEVLDTAPEVTDTPDARPAPALRGEVSFEGVSFAYEPGRPVLHEISLTVAAGRTVAIVGATGSGKSTILSLVPRLFDPAAGRVLIDGADVREYTLRSLRAQVSIVQQEPILFGLSMAENIRYGCPEATDEQVRAAASAAGMDDFVGRLPDGHDTILAERGASLSGGQRQRVTIARALIRNSPILLLDEPTTGLDAATERGIFDALQELMHDKTTLLVTHHMPLVREADEIVVIDDGRVAAQGGYDELLAGSPEFRRLAAPRARRAANGSPPVTAQRGGDGARASFESHTVVGAGHLQRQLDLASAFIRRLAAPRARRAANGSPPVTAQRGGDGARALFYAHNGVGVGHLQRQLDLASAFKAAHPDAAALVATGSHAAGLFALPPGVDYVKLPSIKMIDRYENWDPRDLPVPREEVVELRSELLERTVIKFAPDLLVADFMPRGPYGELLPALEALDARGGVAVAGFRDVIDDPAFVCDLWERTGVYDALRSHYHTICVYGDPLMVDFADAYGLDSDITAKLRYCGYLGRRPPVATTAPLYDRPLVLANGGGGADGGQLLEAFVAAAQDLRPHRGGTWLMVTGPMINDATHDRLARAGEAAGLTVHRAVPELRAHVALADCVVGMAGYNTCCDLLTFRRPSVLVPRQGPSREQTIRAHRFEDWGMSRLLPAPYADRIGLADAIARALDGGAPPTPPVPLAGLDAAVDAFDLALATSRTAV